MAAPSDSVVRLVAGDVTAATISAGLVAPFVAAADKAIAQSAAGQATVWESVGLSMKEMVSSPIQFLRAPAFRYLWVMYGGTYGAANLFTTYDDVKKTSQPLVKTTSIFCVNTSLSLWKDSAFAKLFSGKPPGAVPKPALASWYFRDFMSMAVIFTAPPIAAKYMHESMGYDKSISEVACQALLPLMVQPFVAPFHLYGYVLYNDPTASRSAQMIAMRREIWGAVQMRLARCVAPYSCGTNLNKAIRKHLREM